MAKKKEWKPGQLVTIKGTVYRVMHCTPDAPFYPYECDGCAFVASFACAFPINVLDPTFCWDLIPKDCYFVKVYPKS